MPNTVIIGIVGLIGSGKDTVADHFVSQGGVKESFARSLKDAASVIFGWPRELLEGDTIRSREFRETPDMYWTRKLGIDNFTPRLGLQLLGTDVLRNHFHKDIWIHSLENRIMRLQSKPNYIVVSDARFKNELDLIKSMGGKIIWVQREETPDWFRTAVEANAGNVISRKIMTTRYASVHASEWDWAGYPVDHVIQNTGTLSELYAKIDVYIAQLEDINKTVVRTLSVI
jgi:hypothetical protein